MTSSPLRPVGLIFALVAVLSQAACRHAQDPARGEDPVPERPPSDERVEPTRFPEWSRACGEGEARACRLLFSSILNLSRFDVARSAQTRDGLERGCEAGIGDACGALILTRSFTEDALPAPDAFEPACALGSPWSCTLLYLGEDSATRDPEARASMLRRGVERCRSVGDICFAVAGALEEGPDGEGFPSPLQTLRDGCAKGDALSCVTIGTMHEGMRDVSGEAAGTDDEEATADRPSVGEARQALTLACDAELGHACYLLALQLLRGEGGPAAPAEGRKHARQACTLGTREACDFLAMTNGGRTFPPPQGAEAYPDAASWQAAQREACELGGHLSCVRVAMAQLRAALTATTAAPVDEALSLLVRTCDEGEQSACFSLVRLVGSASQACETSGDRMACLLAGVVLQGGLEVPPAAGESVDPDPERAHRMLSLACEAGLQAGCERGASARPDDK